MPPIDPTLERKLKEIEHVDLTGSLWIGTARWNYGKYIFILKKENEFCYDILIGETGEFSGIHIATLALSLERVY